MKKKLITLSVAAIAVCTLVFAFGCNPKTTKVESKKWDDVVLGFDNIRIVNDGGLMYLATAGGKKLTKGWYEIDLLATDVIGGKDAQTFFAVRKTPSGGLGIMNKKGKLVSDANKDGTFKNGNYQELKALYSFKDGYSAVSGFIGVEASGKATYLTLDGNSGTSFEQLINYDASHAVMSNTVETDGVKTQNYVVLLPGGGTVDCGNQSPSTEKGWFSATVNGVTNVYFASGRTIGNVASAFAIDRTDFGCARLTDGAYTIFDYTEKNPDIHLGAGTVSLSGEQLLYTDSSNKKSLYAELDNRAFGALFSDVDSYTQGPGTGVSGDSIAIVSDAEGTRVLKIEYKTYGYAVLTIGSGLSSSASAFVIDGTPYALDKAGSVHNVYKNNTLITSFDESGVSDFDASKANKGYYTYTSGGANRIFSLTSGIEYIYTGASELNGYVKSVENADSVEYEFISDEIITHGGAGVPIYTAPKTDPAPVVTPIGDVVRLSDYDIADEIIEYDFVIRAYQLPDKDGKPARIVFVVISGDKMQIIDRPIDADYTSFTAIGESGAYALGNFPLFPKLDDGGLSCSVTVLPCKEIISMNDECSVFVGKTADYNSTGAWDAEGNNVIAPVYDSVKAVSSKIAVVQKANKYAALKINGKNKDKLLTDFVYVSAESNNYFTQLKKFDGYIDILDNESGKILVKNAISIEYVPYWSSILGTPDELALLKDVKNGKKQFIIGLFKVADKKGNVIILSQSVNKDNYKYLF